MANTDYFTKVGTSTATTLAAPGHTIGGTTFNVVSTAAYPTTTGVFFAVDTFDVATGKRVPGSYSVWQGDVTNSTTFSNCVLRQGTDQNYTAGATTRVYGNITAARENRFVEGMMVSHTQDGKLVPAAVSEALGTANLANTGFNALPQTFNSVTYNGNRSYTCVINATNLTTTLSPGMRLRTQRTVAAPTQSTSLNGTNQYWSKTAPAGMTFTDDFTVSAWVKLTSYQAGVIMSRYDGTSGWELIVLSDGTVRMQAFNGGAGNNSHVLSYQSLPLNKWVHITGQLDMSAFTATTTTSYIMFDGVDVPARVVRAGTNPTALVQAGTLMVGERGSSSALFPGKIAQAAVFSSKLTQDVARSYYSQGLTGTETSLVSAYSFNGNANDLNTTNANNLTSNNGATATNADSPFGGQADGTISSTLDYGIVQKATFSTNTTVIVQVAEGCTIPTSGGVAAVAYSSQANPYNFPGVTSIAALAEVKSTISIPTAGESALNGLSVSLNVPTDGKRYKISAYIPWIQVSSGAPHVGFMTVWDGAVGSGIVLSRQSIYLPLNTQDLPQPMVTCILSPTSGTKAYNVSLSIGGAVTKTIAAGTTAPAYLLVEDLTLK